MDFSVIDRLSRAIDNFRDIALECSMRVMEDNAEVMVEQVRSQLLEGIGSDGQPLHPTYMEDDYFKSQEEATAYVMRKAGGWAVAPFNSMPSNGSPNLGIKGTFHNGLQYNREGDEMVLTSSFKGDEIMSKYDYNIGVTEDWFEENLKEPICEEIVEQIRSML